MLTRFLAIAATLGAVALASSTTAFAQGGGRDRYEYLAEKERAAAHAGNYEAAEHYRNERYREARHPRFVDTPAYRDSAFYSSLEYRRLERRRRRIFNTPGN